MCLHPGPITKSKSCPNKWCLYKIATQPQDAGQHHFTTKSGTTMDMLLNPQIRLYKKKVCTGGYRLRFCRGNWWGDVLFTLRNSIGSICQVLLSLLFNCLLPKTFSVLPVKSQAKKGHLHSDLRFNHLNCWWRHLANGSSWYKHI